MFDCPKGDLLVLEDLDAEIVLLILREETRFSTGELSHLQPSIDHWALDLHEISPICAVLKKRQYLRSVRTNTATLSERMFRVFGFA
jgi:hypothetical protein